MRLLLHVLTQPEDGLAAKIIGCQEAQPGCRVGIVDLTAPDPDYEALLEKIFTADSVQVW